MGFRVNNFLHNKLDAMPTFLQFRTVPNLVNDAKAKAYWKDRSGHARQKLTGGVEGTSKECTLYLSHGVDYGEILENGSGIYGPTGKAIVPVRAKVLSWVDTNGKRHFAKKVNGIKPMPILKDTLENNKDTIIDEIVQYWGG